MEVLARYGIHTCIYMYIYVYVLSLLQYLLIKLVYM